MLKLLLIIIIIIGVVVIITHREGLGQNIGYYAQINNTMLADQAGVFSNIECKYNDATDRVKCWVKHAKHVKPQ